jgi:hypothetical protein
MKSLACTVMLCAALLSAQTIIAADAPRVTLTPAGGVLVDGKPFLPIIVWAQPSSTIPLQKELGMNTIHCGESADKDPPKAYLDKLQAAGLMGLFGVEAITEELSRHPAILAWTVEHEPDGAQPAGYQADLGGDARIVWIEGEAAKENTFKHAPWLDQKMAQLSGGKWLTADPSGEGKAVFEFDVRADGSYHLWVREFTKNWANPTRWTLDDKPAQETPRTLDAKDNINLGSGRGVAWSEYAKVELTKGKHKLTFEIVAGRTLGKAAEPGKEALWAVDAICLTTDASYPPALKAEPTPTRSPTEQKANFDKVKAVNPKALTWNILTAGFFGGYNKLPMRYYDEFLKTTDITSFDHYPVTGWNQPGNLPEVGLATRKLASLARPGQPVWTIVEASDQELSWTPPETPGPTAAEMRAEIWMGIANGAKGIGYFTIAFGAKKKDGFKWNHLTDEIKAELKRSNAQLTALTGPIVMGDTKKALTVANDATDDKAAEGHAIQAIRKEFEGKTYVIAVNVTRKDATPTFTLAEPPTAAEAAVWQENRTVPLKDGAFSDTFKPLEVHVYEIK